MCGIIGYIGTNELSDSAISESLKTIKLRGPDSNGVRKIDGFKNIWFLHSRLSIIDLEGRSSQPFETDEHILIYNGEIYNFIELREELKSLGVNFRTESDTEVLCESWRVWGKEALQKFDGMWSFAIYDKLKNSVHIATDFFGEKPLYLLEKQDGGIFFGSRIDSVLELSGLKAEPNYNHLNRYLLNGYKSLFKYDDTFVNQVKRLPGGYCLEIDRFGLKKAKYSSISCRDDKYVNQQTAIDEIKHCLITSVSRRMRSDVSLAFCMSGGIDSNTIISIASKTLGMDVTGFTVLNNDGRYDEEKLVDYSTHELGIKNIKVKPSDVDMIDHLSSMILDRVGPVSTISYYTHNLLQKKIHDFGFKVSISGTGADELFTGYYDHHLLFLASEFPTKEDKQKADNNWENFIKPITRNPLLQDKSLYIGSPNFREHIYFKNKFYGDFLKHDWSENFIEERYSTSLLRNRMLNELFHEAVPMILSEDDANSMMYSIENRSPFLSVDLLKTVLRVPDHMLIQNGYAKYLLRQAMIGIVPDRILWERKKVGFNSSLFEFINLKDKQIRDFVLDQSSIYDLVDREKVEKYFFSNIDVQNNSDSKFLFSLINAKIFLEML